MASLKIISILDICKKTHLGPVIHSEGIALCWSCKSDAVFASTVVESLSLLVLPPLHWTIAWKSPYMKHVCRQSRQGKRKVNYLYSNLSSEAVLYIYVLHDTPFLPLCFRVPYPSDSMVENFDWDSPLLFILLKQSTRTIRVLMQPQWILWNKRSNAQNIYAPQVIMCMNSTSQRTPVSVQVNYLSFYFCCFLVQTLFFCFVCFYESTYMSVTNAI